MAARGHTQFNERELLRVEAACRSGLAAAFQSSAALADFGLILPSCFLTSTSGVLDLGGVGGLPAAVLPAMAGSALPLPSCLPASFLPSVSMIFVFTPDDGLPDAITPGLAASTLPLPSCLLASFLPSVSATAILVGTLQKIHAVLLENAVFA